MTEWPASGTVKKKIVKGRKAYKCCECRKVIEKGEKHESFEACWPSCDGWDTFRTCLKCVKIKGLALAKYDSSVYHEEVGFGELYDYIREMRRC